MHTKEIAKRIALRLNSAEHAHLKQLSSDTGLKMEPVIRQLIMGVEVRSRPPDEIADLRQQLTGIAANINQIAKAANASGFGRTKEINRIKRYRCGSGRR